MEVQNWPIFGQLTGIKSRFLNYGLITARLRCFRGSVIFGIICLRKHVGTRSNTLADEFAEDISVTNSVSCCPHYCRLLMCGFCGGLIPGFILLQY